MDIHSRFMKITEEQEKRQQEVDAEFYKVFTEGSKKRLEDQARKRMTTTFVGIIAKIEESFGHLWGKDRPYRERDQYEREMTADWNVLRRQILDHGNSQIRILLTDINDYEIKFKNKGN